MKTFKQYGLFKKVGSKWVREFPEKSFKKAKAGKVFATFVTMLPKFDKSQRAIRPV